MFQANNEIENDVKVSLCLSRRLGVGVFLFFATFWVFTMRVNMNVSIVCMVNQTALKQGYDVMEYGNTSSQCGEINGNVTVPAHKDGTFMWDKSSQAIILGAYFWPYAIFQIPAGILALKIGAYRLLGCSFFLISSFTVLIPVLSQASYFAVVVLRGLIGLVSSSIFVGCQYFLSHWVPLHERSRISSLSFMGKSAANVITYVTSGVLCKYGFDGGWPSIFYIHGVGGFIFCILWFVLMHDKPHHARRMSQIEQTYIQKYLQRKDDVHYKKFNKGIPWKRIFTSLPVYAMTVALSASDFSFTFMETFVPSYLDDIFAFDLETIGLISAVPPIFILLACMFGGVSSDYIQNRCLSRCRTRKLFSAISMIIPASLMLALGYVDCSSSVLGVILLTSSMGFRGFRHAGFMENALDIDPRYASIIYGMANTVANISGFLVSVMVGSVVDNSTREEWQFCFYVAAAVEVFGALFYIVFASTNVQLSKDRDKTIVVLVSVVECPEYKQTTKLENGGLSKTTIDVKKD